MSFVVTTINPPTPAMQELAEQCSDRNEDLLVIGDEKSPRKRYHLNCQFFSLADQLGMEYASARLGRKNHYSRKNVGYLLAMQSGADVIAETDDDNFIRPRFWEYAIQMKARHLVDLGWVNIYQYFNYYSRYPWPRGFPLEAIQTRVPLLSDQPKSTVYCPIQQYLCDGNPDIDAIHRLVFQCENLEFCSDQEQQVILGAGSWCPFNSQVTRWFPDAYPLMYLPNTCMGRMSDILRSFVARRIATAKGWGVAFLTPGAFQKRNVHNLIKDFEEEIPGYLRNADVVIALEDCKLTGDLKADLQICYSTLADDVLLAKEELIFLDFWLQDLKEIGQ